MDGIRDETLTATVSRLAGTVAIAPIIVASNTISSADSSVLDSLATQNRTPEPVDGMRAAEMMMAVLVTELALIDEIIGAMDAGANVATNTCAKLLLPLLELKHELVEQGLNIIASNADDEQLTHNSEYPEHEPSCQILPSQATVMELPLCTTPRCTVNKAEALSHRAVVVLLTLEATSVDCNTVRPINFRVMPVHASSDMNVFQLLHLSWESLLVSSLIRMSVNTKLELVRYSESAILIRSSRRCCQSCANDSVGTDDGTGVGLLVLISPG